MSLVPSGILAGRSSTGSALENARGAEKVLTKSEIWPNKKSKCEAVKELACGAKSHLTIARGKRKTAPPVYNRVRGDQKLAMATARDPVAMDEAMHD